ncbi:MAG: PAS domain S-box protein [Alphaproteobacteria bacterium]|nr:PAS domain S-box protein [Alphaproteobacteria bacterium]
MINSRGEILSFNKAATQIFGYQPEEVMGLNVNMLMPEPYHSEHGAYIHNYLETGSRKVIGIGREVSGRRKSGEVFPMELGVNDMIVGEKRVFVGIIRDMTAQKNAENALRGESLRLLAIMNAAPGGIMTVDITGTITSVNTSLLKIFDYEESELIGQKIEVLIPEQYLSKHQQDMSQYMLAGGARQMALGRDVVGKRKDGSVVPLEIGLSKTKLPDGKMQVIAAVQDCSLRKSLESQRERLIQKLAESNTKLERFAYIASHDMLEPIRMITNFSALIKSDYESLLDEEGKEYLDVVINSGGRLKDMVDDLLAYSRLESDNTQMRDFDGQELVSGLLGNLRRLIEERGVEITCDQFPTLYGNPVQLLRLLQNLVANGIKYQPENNVPRIHMGIQDQGDVWQLSVTDNGMGIKPEYLEQVFEPFRRLHSWDQIQGVGLGLSICKKIAENHSGRIWATSTPGRGSVFAFTIRKYALTNQ